MSEAIQTHDSAEQNQANTRQKVVVHLTEGVPSDVRETVLTRLAETFGGFTETTARGGWIDPDGELVTERVTSVESVRMDGDAPSAEAVARSTAEWVAEKTDEHSVMWEVETVSAGLER